ncbi:MAG: hypothetical protein WBL88_14810, partial [Nitrososphaeraceae archaeon]
FRRIHKKPGESYFDTATLSFKLYDGCFTILCKFDNPCVSTEAKCYINLLNNWKRVIEEYNTLRMSLQQPL